MALETGPVTGARYAAMEAADPDEDHQPFTSDFLHLKRGRAGPPWPQRLQPDRRSLLRSASVAVGLLLATGLLGGVVTVSVMRAAMLKQPQLQTTFNSWCITPLGGGMVGLGGDFRHYNSTDCTLQLQQYFAPGGAYTREVELVADMATSFFQTQLPGNTSQLIVFDIDETALSNLRTFFTADGLHLASTDVRQFGQSNSGLPPLQPMLQLYNYLYSCNYSVAFVTGRSEPAREVTAANIASAGFGILCPDDPSTGGSSGHRALHARANTDGLRKGVPPAKSPESRPRTPCYSALVLRALGDVRYASVYKPEARGALRELGYQIVGNLGDQFSDLVGLNDATPGSFKMPNPVYYIL